MNQLGKNQIRNKIEGQGQSSQKLIGILTTSKDAFLAATKQLYEWFSPSVRPWHLFHNVPVIISSWNLQKLLPLTEVTSMRKFKVRGKGQGHRGHDPT